MVWRLIGLCAACLTSFAFIPQIKKSLATKSVRDVSLIMLFQLILGSSLWIVYGIYLKDTIIITANSITLLSLFILIVLHFLYERTVK